MPEKYSTSCTVNWFLATAWNGEIKDPGNEVAFLTVSDLRLALDDKG